MKKNNYTLRPIIWLILAVIIALGAYSFLYLGVTQKADAVQTIQNELLVQQEREERLKALGTLVDDLEDTSARLMRYFAESDTVISVIEEIETVAESTGVRVDINNVALNEAGTNATVGTLQLDFKLQGSWSGITHALRALDTFPLYSFMQTLSLQHISTDAESGVSQWQANVSFTVGVRE